MTQVHWLSSLPQKYRNEIVEHLLKSKMDLNQEHQYKIVVDLLGDFQKRLHKEMQVVSQNGLANSEATTQMIKELVGNNPRLEGINPKDALH